MQCVDTLEVPKPLIITMTTFQEIQIIDFRNTSWILSHGAPLLNYGIPWLFMHTYNQFMEVNSFIKETHNLMVELQSSVIPSLKHHNSESL